MEYLSAYCSALAMERLLSPCTRYRDIAESHIGHLELGRNPEGLRELNLDVSIEELLGAFTYADLYSMLGNDETVVWLTPHAAVMRPCGKAHLCCNNLLAYSFHFKADGKDIFVATSSSAARLDTFATVGRLLAASASASELYELDFRFLCRLHQVFDFAPTLSNLMEQYQSLKILSLNGIEMDEDQIRALGAVSILRPGLEIKLVYCRISGASAEALAELLQRNQGPTELQYCDFDNFILADALRGNSRLVNLRVLCRSSPNEVGNREFLAIMSALRQNKGLVNLAIWLDLSMSDESWGAVCDLLKTLTHPTLQVLDLETMKSIGVDPALLNSRMPVFVQALVDMLKVNMSIRTIPWSSFCPYPSSELFQGSVDPYLETNKFRPRLLAIQKSRPFTYRVKVLGRALLATRTDPNLFWMLLSGNAEIIFPPTTANFPSPVIGAAATSDASVLPANATGASAAANATTPTACLKRKARPSCLSGSME
jgi:hypothetical protein